MLYLESNAIRTAEFMQKEPSRSGSTVSGVFFVAGTAIGAGMLALPFVTGAAGFLPSLVMSTLCWLYMMATGLLFLEAVLWLPDGANLLSIAHRLLGSPGRLVGGAIYLFLYYSIMIAYFSGGVPIFSEVVQQITSIALPPGAAYPLFTLIFGGVVLAGAHVTDRLNFCLVIGMIIAYILLVTVGTPEIEKSLLVTPHWNLTLSGAIPVVIGAYGFHNVIPSISTYLKRDVKRLRLSIVIGATIPFLVYTFWQLVVMGIIPPALIESTLASGKPIGEELSQVVLNPLIAIAAQYFSFFALTTSVLGVSLALVDFLGDGLKIPRKGWNRLLLCLMVFLPPLLCAWSTPGLFFKALRYAGAFGEAVLNGLFPILLVWVGRYKMRFHSDYCLWGGRWTLSLLLGTTLGVFAVQTLFA